MEHEFLRTIPTKVSPPRASRHVEQLHEYVERLRRGQLSPVRKFIYRAKHSKDLPAQLRRYLKQGPYSNPRTKSELVDPRTIEVSCRLPQTYSRHRIGKFIRDGRSNGLNPGGPVDRMDYFFDTHYARDYGIRFFCPGFLPTPLKDMPA